MNTYVAFNSDRLTCRFLVPSNKIKACCQERRQWMFASWIGQDAWELDVTRRELLTTPLEQVMKLDKELFILLIYNNRLDYN